EIDYAIALVQKSVARLRALMKS
ncbi:hypothetical protein, partial [Pantoea vagans]